MSRRRASGKTALQIMGRARRNLIRLGFSVAGLLLLWVVWFDVFGALTYAKPAVVAIDKAELERRQAQGAFIPFRATLTTTKTKPLLAPRGQTRRGGPRLDTYLLARVEDRWLLVHSPAATQALHFQGTLEREIPIECAEGLLAASTDPTVPSGVYDLRLEVGGKAPGHQGRATAIFGALVLLGLTAWPLARAIRLLPDPSRHPAFAPLARDRDPVEAMADLDEALHDDPPPGPSRWVYTAGDWVVGDSRWDARFVELDDVRRYAPEKRRVSGGDADLPFALSTYRVHVECADGRRFKLQCRGGADMGAALDELHDALGFAPLESVEAMDAARYEEQRVAAQTRSRRR